MQRVSVAPGGWCRDGTRAWQRRSHARNGHPLAVPCAHAALRAGRELAMPAPHVRCAALRDGGAHSQHPMSVTTAVARRAALRDSLAPSPHAVLAIAACSLCPVPTPAGRSPRCATRWPFTHTELAARRERLRPRTLAALLHLRGVSDSGRAHSQRCSTCRQWDAARRRPRRVARRAGLQEIDLLVCRLW